MRRKYTHKGTSRATLYNSFGCVPFSGSITCRTCLGSGTCRCRFGAKCGEISTSTPTPGGRTTPLSPKSCTKGGVASYLLIFRACRKLLSIACNLTRSTSGQNEAGDWCRAGTKKIVMIPPPRPRVLFPLLFPCLDEIFGEKTQGIILVGVRRNRGVIDCVTGVNITFHLSQDRAR